MYDFIIIGAGFGGLSTAALLARRGKSVLLLETKDHAGGRAFYFEKDGFTWQYGQHSHRLGSDGHANEVMKRLGDPLDFFEAPKGKSKIFFRGRLYDRPEGAWGFLTTKALSFSSRLKFLRLYIKIKKLDSCEWYDRTLLDLYRSFFKPDSELEEFLNFLGFTIMLPDASLVSAGEVIDFIQRVSRVPVPVADVPGGSKQIIDKLVRAIEAHGGEIRFGEKVTSLKIEKKRIRRVVTEKDEFSGDNVVFAAPIKGLARLMPGEALSPGFVKYAASLQNSGGVVIDFVSREPLADLPGGILGVDEPLWVKFQTLFDDTVAPAGYHVCSWGLLTEWGKADDRDAQEATEKRLREIAEICMPGFSDRVVRERKLIIPVVNANMLIPSQSRPHRPGVRSEDIDNLFLAGDTVSAVGCSGDIAFASALLIDDMAAETD